jgi:hypothetical protein
MLFINLPVKKIYMLALTKMSGGTKWVNWEGIPKNQYGLLWE